MSYFELITNMALKYINMKELLYKVIQQYNLPLYLCNHLIEEIKDLEYSLENTVLIYKNKPDITVSYDNNTTVITDNHSGEITVIPFILGV